MRLSPNLNKSNGRIEIRRCWTLADPLAFEYIRPYEAWAGLQPLVRVQRECRTQDATSLETAYYISRLPHDAERLLDATRHHWVLDVTFREDDSHILSGDSPQHRAVFRHLALNLLKQDPSKMRLQQKRFRAGLDDPFLLALLSRI